MIELSGKGALITGSPRRVGLEIGRALMAAGCNVIFTYRSNEMEANEACVLLEEEFEGTANYVRMDFSQRFVPMALVQAVNDQLGGLDILVNNASSFQKGGTASVGGAWEESLNVILEGPRALVQVFKPALAHSGGCVVNIADLFGVTPGKGFEAHSVAKAALLALTRAQAVELAPHVRVNAVVPGLVLPPEGASTKWADEKARGNLLGRWGSPQDVAEAVLFLARSQFVTGTTVVVDGGESLARA